MYDVTDNLMNWDDVELRYKRDNLDGVVRSFSTKFEFANGAYSLLLGEFEKNYLSASASVVFYRRNNSWLWNEVFRCALDFSTFSHDGHSCAINAIDDSLAALIKAKKGTQYEYVVDEIKESEPLKYDHLQMKNNIKWIDKGTLNEEGTESTLVVSTQGQGEHHPLPIIVSTAEIVGGNLIEYVDVYPENESNAADITPFITAIDNVDIDLDIRFLLKNNSDAITIDYYLTLYKRFADGTLEVLKEQHLQGSTEFTEFSYNGTISLAQGDSLLLDAYMFGSEYYGALTLYISEFEISATFMDRVREVVDIDLIKPITILNRLLKSMNGGVDGLTGEIADTDGRLNNTMLMAADSARGLQGAKFYSSYTKFVDWMEAEFGFVPVIGDKKVTFVHRDSLFRDERVKDLGADLSGFEYSVNAGMIYSRVRVGYDKVDYESVNGLDEFRFTNEYTTGTTLTDGSLELISPYRADAYGVEFLVNKRGEDTTDDESDNDVFMVGVYKIEDSYQLKRDIPIDGVIAPDTMFNAMYAQRYMIAANEGLIGSFSKQLEYASSDGNSDAVIDGVRGDSDLSISKQLFVVAQLDVETADISLPTDLTGYVEVVNRGKTYQGYVRDVGLNVGREERVKYSLIVKNIEN